MPELSSLALFSDSALKGYWKLEDANDSSSSGYNLTNNNSVTFPAGRFNNGGNFVKASSQSLTIANASCPNLEITGSCTWMAWIKPATVSGADFHIMAKDKAASSVFRQFYISSSAPLFQCSGLTTNSFVQSSVTLSVGSWYLVVGIYDSANSKLKVWVNNTKTEVTASGSMTASDQPFCIGKNNANAYFDGIIDDVAVFNRALTDAEVTTLYSNVSDSYTKALLHFDGPDAGVAIIDESGKTWTAVGNAQIDTAQYKFGGASLLLDGTGDYVKTPSDTDFNLGSDDFTVDFRIRFNALPATNSNFALVHHVHTDDSGWQINVYDDAGVHSLDFRNYTGASYTIDIKKAITTLSTNTWYHIAVVRNGSNFYFFLDGVQQSTTGIDADTTTDNTAILYLGSNRNGASAVNGWIDEFRLSKGIARWTANFTPPVTAYPVPSSNGGFFNFM